MKLFSRTRILLLLSLSLAIFSLSLFFYVGLLIKGEYDEVSIIESEIYEKRKQEAQIGDVRRILDNSLQEREKISSFIVPKEGEASFVESFEKLAGENNVSLSVSNLSVRSSSNNVGLDVITMTAEVEGSFRNVYRFVALVEEEPRALSLDSLSFDWLGEEDEGVSWRALIEVSALKEK